jgi:cysteinyl-tRNA synthetase
MSKSLGNVISLREALERWGRETLLLYFLTAHWRSPMDFGDEMMEQARAQVETFRNVFRMPSEPRGDWAAFAAALEDDFNTAEALAVLHGWRDHELLSRALGIFGLASFAEDMPAPADVIQLAERRLQARARSEFGESDALRAEIEAAGWEVRDVEDGYRLVPR